MRTGSTFGYMPFHHFNVCFKEAMSIIKIDAQHFLRTHSKSSSHSATCFPFSILFALPITTQLQ